MPPALPAVTGILPFRGKSVEGVRKIYKIDRKYQCLPWDDSLRETIYGGGCCPGVSLRSTPRLFRDFSCRKSQRRAGGLPSGSPYSYAVTGGGCKLPRYREGVAKLRFCHQCRDIALRCGLVTKELCKRAKGTSLHLGSSATPSIHDGCGRASTRPYVGLYLVLWCKPKSCALRLILMIPLYFLALCPCVSLLALLANLVRLANGKFFTNILVIWFLRFIFVLTILLINYDK